ncbi:MAG TPA: M23 family metallopeptidase [Kofleriaceae bacterium]|nr:M23 family metallopeptidase [Kofleriaceae bacterium]
MRWLVVFLIACGPPPRPSPPALAEPPPLEPTPAEDPMQAPVVGRMIDFAFDGGRVEIETRHAGDRVYVVAHNHYAVPLVVAWQLDNLENLEPLAPASGVVVLPAAAAPNADAGPVLLSTLQMIDPTAAFRHATFLHERFGDPAARPRPYIYRLPYRAGETWSVLQGFHGAFSHRGSDEYAIDFDCPVATHVLAARPGVVVAANAAAQGAGTTPEFLDYRRTNFVIVLHDDGTLGEYMHLSPSGVEVEPGQRVKRGDELALSGNTGFSSTPHLHFMVMTAAEDGRTALSFPFRVAVAPGRSEEPVQGRAYPSWE